MVHSSTRVTRYPLVCFLVCLISILCCPLCRFAHASEEDEALRKAQEQQQSVVDGFTQALCSSKWEEALTLC